MHPTTALAAVICLAAGPSLAQTPTVCSGRIELLSVTPQWVEGAEARQAVGLRVAFANRSGEPLVVQPVLQAWSRPQPGPPVFLQPAATRTVSLALAPEQQGRVAPEELILGLGASCRIR
ncbi:MAG: hypothetical protein JWR10_2317 [Rubritepida sp.]|nr:hypothetical protein [Rubritepida sp.]